MKKSYQSPATKLVTVKVTHLMDQSLKMSGSPAKVSNGEYETLSRRGSSWDDGDE